MTLYQVTFYDKAGNSYTETKIATNGCDEGAAATVHDGLPYSNGTLCPAIVSHQYLH